MIKIIIFLIISSILLFSPETSHYKHHFAVIPHFMLANYQVEKFYNFIKSSRYAFDPKTIIIISPNHFNPQSKTPQTICCIPLSGKMSKGQKNCNIFFKNQTSTLSPLPNTPCDENIFYTYGNLTKTDEHGIWEHLSRITKTFPNTKTIIPLILPTHLQPDISNLKSAILKLESNILFIASVDFSHYKPEKLALSNDQLSIQTLQSNNSTRDDFRNLDVDCPSCLFLTYSLAQKEKQKADIRYRDSSSTILWKDMKYENTSRVFVWFREIFL